MSPYGPTDFRFALDWRLVTLEVNEIGRFRKTEFILNWKKLFSFRFPLVSDELRLGSKPPSESVHGNTYLKNKSCNESGNLLYVSKFAAQCLAPILLKTDAILLKPPKRSTNANASLSRQHTALFWLVDPVTCFRKAWGITRRTLTQCEAIHFLLHDCTARTIDSSYDEERTTWPTLWDSFAVDKIFFFQACPQESSKWCSAKSAFLLSVDFNVHIDFFCQPNNESKDRLVMPLASDAGFRSPYARR